MDVPSRPSPDRSDADGTRSAPGPVGPSSREEQLTRLTALARTRADKRGKRFTAALRVEGGSSCDGTAARIAPAADRPTRPWGNLRWGGAVDAALQHIALSANRIPGPAGCSPGPAPDRRMVRA